MKMSTATEMPLLLPEALSEISESDIKVELSKIKEATSPVSDWEVKFDFDHANLPAIYIYGTIEDDEIKDEKIRFSRRMKNTYNCPPVNRRKSRSWNFYICLFSYAF